MSDDMINHDYEMSIEQIAASLAHEVKNPISLVRANLDLLELNDTLHEFTRNYVMMRRELDKINELIIDFISFAQPYKKIDEAVNLQDMISELVGDMSVALKDVSFRVEMAGKDFVISGDRTKIENVFNNILKNAVEAIDYDGDVTVDMRNENGYVIISITDSGCGVEDIEQIMEAFYTTKENGSGLGLFISHKTIANHKGELLIENGAEKGCIVTVKLPKKKS